MKVTLLIYALDGGGAQRVMSILANYWARSGWDVTLILLIDDSQPPFYPLVPEVKLRQLGIIGDSPSGITLLKTGWSRMQILRSAIVESKPNVMISFINTVNVLTSIASWNLNIPIIVSEHTYPAFTDVNKIWQLVMKWTYRHADRVALLTQSALPFYPIAQGYRPIVIPNPVLTPVPEISTVDGGSAGTGRLLPTPMLIAVGRLHEVKGFDLLLTAFSQIQAKYPDWHLTILGEGPMRSALEDLRSQLGLKDRVHFPGQVADVNAYLRQADIFVLSSRFEGFPMAICEAMACGLPVLAVNCLSGPSDIIRDGIDGVLVPANDIDALASGIEDLIANPDKRQRLAQAAPQILERFGLERVMELWTDTVFQVTKKRREHSTITKYMRKINNTSTSPETPVKSKFYD
jgi:GalNAc-alpha-(1->4)-GalNAc-alpha-(1->3)-diNAcBac-PP-undecaprenol alpha-1,4-N-acetyl-D-galactosaminyltransferase